MQEKIVKIKESAEKELMVISDIFQLESWERKYLGRNGQLRDFILQLKQLDEGQRKKVGKLVNDIKEELKAKMTDKKIELGGYRKEVVAQTDITLPGEKINFGHLHPSTQVKNEVMDVFQSMGFEIFEGPEVENEYYNFETLNIPADHPARDMWDTFYLKQIMGCKLLLRTHTSNTQVRIMEKRKPPLRACVIGKCFRHEATDATHEHTLYQIEGFVVDEKISLANLIYTLKAFLGALYKREIKLRIRPAYFPFVEPGLEVDMDCQNCGGRGCPVCKGGGWIELLGAGMIHPKVFEAAGYPKGKYTGFAFGVGLDRLVMMRYKIDDIRWLHSGDLRFIRQF